MSNTMLGWYAVSATIAVLIALLARQRGWGMALPVLAAGAIFGFLPVGPSAPPDPEVVLIAILAPLVFGEALSSSYLDIRRVSKPVLVLAIGLVLATTAAVGGVVLILTAVPVSLAFALGAVLAPTDAVAVSSVARKAGLPRRLISILEGESLVNDGTGLTLLRVAVIAAVAGSVTIVEVGITFVLAVICGVAVGLGGGWGISWIMARSKDSVAANSLTLMAPILLYFAAEAIEGSGILAVVVAGLFIAHSQTSDMRQTGRLQSGTLWRHITFVLQAMAFFLVGLEVAYTATVLPTNERLKVGILVLIVTAVLIITRVIFIYVMMRIVEFRRSNRPPMRNAMLGAWAGTRGPVSGLAAVSIPFYLKSGEPLPYRDTLLATTFGVIVMTLLLSLTIAPLARRLGVQSTDDTERIRQIDGALAHAAMRRLELAQEQASLVGEPIPDEVVAPLRLAVERRLRDIHEQFNVEVSDAAGQRMALQRMMVRAEQVEILRIRDEEGIPDAIVRPIQAALDVRALAAKVTLKGEQ